MTLEHFQGTKTERELLESILDCLDRVFDNESHVVDLHALIRATGVALEDSQHASTLEAVEQRLAPIVRSGSVPAHQRDAALVATDDFRKYLAAILP